MAAECDPSALESAMKWGFTLIGWGVAAWGWRVSGKQARDIQQKLETNKCIDTALTKLDQFEELVIDFYTKPDHPVVYQQLTAGMQRCSHSINQIGQLRGSNTPPYQQILSVRKLATLDADSADRGFEKNAERIAQFVQAMSRLRASKTFTKESLTF